MIFYIDAGYTPRAPYDLSETGGQPRKVTPRHELERLAAQASHQAYRFQDILYDGDPRWVYYTTQKVLANPLELGVYACRGSGASDTESEANLTAQLLTSLLGIGV